jgi:hypothetical protein
MEFQFGIFYSKRKESFGGNSSFPLSYHEGVPEGSNNGNYDERSSAVDGCGKFFHQNGEMNFPSFSTAKRMRRKMKGRRKRREVKRARR